jgi:uncharacterized protein (DUF433 family)
MNTIAPRIAIDERVCFGKVVVEGTRIHVSVVLGHLASGMTNEEVAREYGIALEDVLACLAYASRVIDENLPRSAP